MGTATTSGPPSPSSRWMSGTPSDSTRRNHERELRGESPSAMWGGSLHTRRPSGVSSATPSEKRGEW